MPVAIEAGTTLERGRKGLSGVESGCPFKGLLRSSLSAGNVARKTNGFSNYLPEAEPSTGLGLAAQRSQTKADCP